MWIENRVGDQKLWFSFKSEIPQRHCQKTVAQEFELADGIHVTLALQMTAAWLGFLLL